MKSIVLAAALAALAGIGLADDSKVARGKYLVTITSCSDCHTPGALMGKPDFSRNLSGGDVGFAVPELGYFYGPNLTPDEATGLGTWSEDEIVAAVREGVRPDGRKLAPVMPWMSYAAMNDDDAHAVAAYLKSLAPIRNDAEPPPTGWGETPPAPYQDIVMPKGK